MNAVVHHVGFITSVDSSRTDELRIRFFTMEGGKRLFLLPINSAVEYHTCLLRPSLSEVTLTAKEGNKPYYLFLEEVTQSTSFNPCHILAKDKKEDLGENNQVYLLIEQKIMALLDALLYFEQPEHEIYLFLKKIIQEWRNFSSIRLLYYHFFFKAYRLKGLFFPTTQCQECGVSLENTAIFHRLQLICFKCFPREANDSILVSYDTLLNLILLTHQTSLQTLYPLTFTQEESFDLNQLLPLFQQT